MYIQMCHAHRMTFGHPNNGFGCTVKSVMDIKMGSKSFGTFHSPCEEYRIAGYFRGVPNFVVNLEVTKFSTNEYIRSHTHARLHVHISHVYAGEEAGAIALFLYVSVLTVPSSHRVL